MRNKKCFEFIAFVTLLICMLIMLSTAALAISEIPVVSPNANQPDAFTIKELNIISGQAILAGDTYQMQVEEFDEFVLLGSVEWSSSNENVISCTKNGEIKGLKEGSAVITVKAKVGSARDSITVYCARKLINFKSSHIGLPFAWTTKTPFFLNVQTIHLYIFDNFPIIVTGKLEIKGVYGSYFYVEFTRNEKLIKGFIPQNWMPENIASDEVFKQLSTYDLDVYAGEDRDFYKITTDYKGSVKWNVSDTNIIYFDEITGKVKGLKPGTATVSATVGEKTLTCTVHSIYKWPLEWTGAARQSTYVYKAIGTSYQKTSTELSVGDSFTVKGDMGNDDGWAYGYATLNGKTYPGYIPISHISTKGTISQYNNMTTTQIVDGKEKQVPWLWPVKNSSINFISSPFGPRSSENGGNHKGFDITTGKSGEIEGEKAVATCKGTIKRIYIDDNKSTSHGNAIVITTDKIDPISGKSLTIIYMHLQSWEKDSLNRITVDKKVIKEGDIVEAGQVIGYIGNTGKNTTGAHLHYEVNNQNAPIRFGENNPFTQTINPLYFYRDKIVVLSTNCEAYTKGIGSYWYDENN